MLCPNCGADVAGGPDFCPYCSFDLRKDVFTSDGRIYDDANVPTDGHRDDPQEGPRVKSTTAAWLLSAFLPGTGAYYYGGKVEGLLIFFVSLLMAIIQYVFVLFMPLTLLVCAVLWILGMILTGMTINPLFSFIIRRI